MFPYKKIAVIGCSGSGKTTFSKKLASITGLPLYHLDLIYWKSDATHLQRPEFQLQEESRINTYCWLDIDELDNYLLYPKFIKDEINNINDGFKLIITRE